ncbi:hypothetical protein P8452_16531 [Trifolium repens]|nr:hypothetical protein P8452_16531 [Trifolium repens]
MRRRIPSLLLTITRIHNAKLPPSHSFFRSFKSQTLPPPELIQPFSDLSDVVSSKQNLQPSPWFTQILNLLDNSSTMESNLNSFCHQFLITLSPSFV